MLTFTPKLLTVWFKPFFFFFFFTAAQTKGNLVFVFSFSMDGFRVVKLSEVIRQMDVVITCTGTVFHAVTGIISAAVILACPANKHALFIFNTPENTYIGSVCEGDEND